MAEGKDGWKKARPAKWSSGSKAQIIKASLNNNKNQSHSITGEVKGLPNYRQQNNNKNMWIKIDGIATTIPIAASTYMALTECQVLY